MIPAARATAAPEAVRADIERRLGRLPNFFALASPASLEILWNQTRAAWIDGPVPAPLREAVFAYLSRFCSNPYLLASRACALRALGRLPGEILLLVQEHADSIETNIERALDPAALGEWPSPGSAGERVLIACTAALYRRSPRADAAHAALRTMLGEERHARIVALVAAVGACHVWAEGRPDLPIERDADLAGLLAAEPGLEPWLVRSTAAAQPREDPERQLVETRRMLSESRHELDERRAIEQDLRRMNTVLENALEGIARLDAAGRFADVNRAWADLLGRTRDELKGRALAETIQAEDAGAVQAALERSRSSGRALVEARAVRRDGSLVPIEMSLAAARDEDGYHAFARDISERRRAEEERALLNAQLLHGQKMQAMGQLAAGIAHEINNPVGYITSNLSMLTEYFDVLAELLREYDGALQKIARGANPDSVRAELQRRRQESDADFILADLRKALDESRDGAKWIREIIAKLREFSHVDEGDVRPTDLAAVMDDAIRICWSELKHKVRIERDYRTLAAVPCHPQRIGQVFVNLLVNAAQAIDDKGVVRITIQENGAWAEMRIRDSGRGIPPENLPKLFQPFFTTKPVGTGTGLGLHVANKIVRGHGGEIAVTSQPGKGAEFVVRLPRSQNSRN
jgi:PAS domain S-box-containing protein